MLPKNVSYILNICLIFLCNYVFAQEKAKNIKTIKVISAGFSYPSFYSFNKNGVLTQYVEHCFDTLSQQCSVKYKFNDSGQIEVHDLTSEKYLYYYNSNHQITKCVNIYKNHELLSQYDTSFVEKYFYENNRLEKRIIIDYSKDKNHFLQDTISTTTYQYSKKHIACLETLKNKKVLTQIFNVKYNNKHQLKSLEELDSSGKVVCTFKIDKYFNEKARIRFYNEKGKLFITKNDFVNFPFTFYNVPYQERYLEFLYYDKKAKIVYDYY